MRGVGRVDGHIGSQSGPPAADALIAALAARQHGVVRRQLRSLGVSHDAIDKRVVRHRLHVFHRGVYAVGHPVLTGHGRWMAGVLAGGPDAVLSHASAAALWALRRSAPTTVDVTVRRSGRRSRPGLRIHRARDLAGQTGTHEGIPVTSPERTILDLAATLQRRPLERLLDQAENTRITHVVALDALARAHPGHRGAKQLLAALHDHTLGTTLTRSELEERFLALCRDDGLPRPRVNHHLEGRERDFVFPMHRLVIETDSWTHHRSRRAFEDDRERDQALARAGWRTLRFTHRQLSSDGSTVAATLRTLMSQDQPFAPDLNIALMGTTASRSSPHL
jgi:very-short-patch-repair endonuclease